MAFNNQKGIASILILIILVLGLIAVFYLVNFRQQIFKSRAGSETVVVKDASGQSLPIDSSQNLPVTKSLDVQVQLNVPTK